MGESGIETSEAPAWLSRLETRREILSKARLGHDSGAGAPCNSCTGCPGLDLHFWRKICRACHCSKDLHDVQEEHPAWAHFQLLGMARPKKPNFSAIKIRGVAEEPVKLDWVPPNLSADMVSDYMACLGGELAPIAGSEGAVRRREQLRRQLPLHDLQSELCCHSLTQQEQQHHQEYISKIKSQVVGVGSIVRVGTVQRGDMATIGAEASEAVPGVMCYSLPLRLSNSGKGVKYTSVPKNSTDKLLLLDNKGNVIKKSAHFPDYSASPILSRIVKDKLKLMRIESDRINSAVEHGPIYDKLFVDLRQLNVPMESDVYLMPIKAFRDEFHVNPKFKDETSAFVESQGGKIMSVPLNVLNNNETASLSPQKGTIFAPNGEVWNWCSQVAADVSKPVNAVYGRETVPTYPLSSENLDLHTQYSNALPNRSAAANSLHNNPSDVPPLPNYNTYPGGAASKPPYQAHQGELQPCKLTSDPDDPNVNQSIKGKGKSIPDEMYGDFRALGINTISSNSAEKCHRCQLPLELGQVAVKAERAGRQASWHPQCFTCKKCDQLLVDLMYFYLKGDIYCGRDYAEVLKVPRCAACDELIFSRSYTAAQGSVYHSSHFCCFHCDAALGGQQYVLEEKAGLPVCLQCDQLTAEQCQACLQRILPAQQGVSWAQLHWHGSCFSCSAPACHKSLLSGKFSVKNNKPFCSAACYQTTLANN